jgi:peptidyl-prolyl cis-trans isomerase B (cyclophilin B)
MYCNRCGKPIKTAQAFCGKCGAPIKHNSENPEQSEIDVDLIYRQLFGLPPANPESKQKQQKTHPLVAYAIVLILSLGIGAGGIFLWSLVAGMMGAEVDPASENPATLGLSEAWAETSNGSNENGLCAITAREPPNRLTVAEADDLNLLQSTMPQPGDTIAILHTNMGDITLRFFPEETPSAYTNFITHANNGYYDGTIFHRVINNFMIQGGDPEGTGMGGENIWGRSFYAEFSPYLRHFRGALAMAQSALPGSIGSQFYIVQNSVLDSHSRGILEYRYSLQDSLFPADKLEAYIRYGGTPHLDFTMSDNGHAVFGQVIDGMDVVDAIAALQVDDGNRPLTQAVIERITVTAYNP